MTLSFVVSREQYRKDKQPTSVASVEHDEEVLKKIMRHQGKKGKKFKRYNFATQQVEAFRYDQTDALRAITRMAVGECRTRELRSEVMKPEKAKRDFEEKANDLAHLIDDREVRAARVQSHMKQVPEYFVLSGGTKAITGDVRFVGIREEWESRIRKGRAANRAKGVGGHGSRAKKQDGSKSLRDRTANRNK